MARRARRRAFLDGILRALISFAILAGGWLYPGIYLSRDSIMRTDPDPRTWPAVLFSLVAGGIYAALALRSLHRAGVNFTNPGVKWFSFQAAILGGVLLLFRQLIHAPLVYSGFLALYLAGAVVAFFVEGPEQGVLDPISSRRVMIALGVAVMGASLAWAWLLKGRL